jgi:7-cyano-7-deazaguanine synthase in queuosine biosynthesis
MVPLSGGYDSVALCCKLLEEGHKVRAHHVHFKNKESPIRWLGEKRACDNIAPYLWNKYGDRFFYNESTFEFQIHWYGVEMVNVAFMLCIAYEELCRHYFYAEPNKTMEEVIFAWGVQATESNFWNYKWDERINGLVAGYLTGIMFDAKIPKVVYPLVKFNKQEVVDLIPKEILDYCFTCRYPKEDLKRCYECASCKRIEGIIP